MKKFLFFILFPLAVITLNDLYGTGYDSTYVLSVRQKFAIPEQVKNGDLVGIWQKTVTWRSGYPVRFMIRNNFRSAFRIDPLSGAVTVADATSINGKVVRQDTVINLIIRSTDARFGFEDDTCEIRIKENSYCIFIDDDAVGGKGTRSDPCSSLSDVIVKPGYAYFFRRGNTIKDKTFHIPGFRATSLHPVILAAYGSGSNPVFDGSGLSSGAVAFDFDNQPTPSAYCYIYNLDIRNYPSMAFRIRTRSSRFGIYNCNFRKNVLKDYSAGLGDIYFFGNPADTLINWGHELINLESSGSWSPIVKTDASGVNAWNIKSATASNLPDKGYNFRFAISYYSTLSHFWFTGGERSLQTRFPYVRIIDGVITGSADAGIFLVTNPTYNGKPERLLIRNVLFRNNENGIYTYNTNINHLVVENCLFDANQNDGIFFRNGGNHHIIRYCSFMNNRNDGIELNSNQAPSTNLIILRNLFAGNKGKSINASSQDCVRNLNLINNTLLENVDLTGSVYSTVQNNIYLSIRGNAVFSNNITVEPGNISRYLRDPGNNDFRVIPAAVQNLKKGQQKVSKGPARSNEPEIGAF